MLGCYTPEVNAEGFELGTLRKQERQKEDERASQ